MNALDSPPVAEAPSESPSIVLDSIRGKGYPLRDWLTSYPLILVALDPYTNESSWILETAGDLLHHYSPADVRVGWLVAADDEGCREFLGPWAERYLTFSDPDRSAILGLGLEILPSLLYIRSDGGAIKSDGWDPIGWRTITEVMSSHLSWSRPLLPKDGDPLPYPGTPAAG